MGWFERNANGWTWWLVFCSCHVLEEKECMLKKAYYIFFHVELQRPIKKRGRLITRGNFGTKDLHAKLHRPIKERGELMLQGGNLGPKRNYCWFFMGAQDCKRGAFETTYNKRQWRRLIGLILKLCWILFNTSTFFLISFQATTCNEVQSYPIYI